MTSGTRLGDFWKLLATNFLTKVAQIFGNFLGYCEKHYSVSKNCCGSFLDIVWEIWTTFYSNIWSHWTWRRPWIYFLLLLKKLLSSQRRRGRITSSDVQWDRICQNFTLLVKFKNLWPFLRVEMWYLAKFWEPNLAILTIWANFHRCKIAKHWPYNLAIWLHCSYPMKDERHGEIKGERER